MLGPSQEVFLSVARQHEAVEAELEAAEEESERIRLRAEKEIAAANAKVRLLRKQKKMWAERVTKMVRRGLASLEELDRVEAEEASCGAPVAVATVEPPPGPVLDFSSWSDSDFLALGYPVNTPGVSFGSPSNS
jgi:hypothetical protein